jgi:hypothetical protein
MLHLWWNQDQTGSKLDPSPPGKALGKDISSLLVGNYPSFTDKETEPRK